MTRLWKLPATILWVPCEKYNREKKLLSGQATQRVLSMSAVTIIVHIICIQIILLLRTTLPPPKCFSFLSPLRCFTFAISLYTNTTSSTAPVFDKYFEFLRNRLTNKVD
jgi:hypothetical protein